MLLRSIVLGTAVFALSAPAVAQDSGRDREFWPDSRHALDLSYEKRATALQHEFAALKQADRGLLTPTHLALLQGKLQDLLASYQRDVDRIDPMYLNADGSRAR